MPNQDDLMFRPDGYVPRRSRRGLGAGLLLAVLVVLGALYWFYYVRDTAPEPTTVEAPPTAPAQAAAPAASEPAIQHPVPAAQAPADFAASLRELLGSSGLALLRETDFPTRFVATVDNLAREHAPAAAWPVLPTPGRFATRAQGDGVVIAEDNAKRYAAFVNFVDKVDSAAAVDLYIGAYPLFQQAYENLGFGKRYFNDRLVEVIDLLLRTPEPPGPLQVRLLEIKGPHQPERPWVRYEFVDERLQGLPAGQKILLRMAPEQRRRLQAKLTEFRGLIVAKAASASAAPAASAAPQRSATTN
ncbi:MAG TPA: DUF3014 domain-containing protein [Ramlibacter sp.]|nr:DUF3014 domain-containing protein [Ramlibacter sp.]